MVIDLILDRKDGVPFNPHNFYSRVCGYSRSFPAQGQIADALDEGTNEDVQNALIAYLKENDYIGTDERPEEVPRYIRSVNWLDPDAVRPS